MSKRSKELMKKLFAEFDKIEKTLRAEGCKTATSICLRSPNEAGRLRWTDDSGILIAVEWSELGECPRACNDVAVIAAAEVLDEFMAAVRAAKIDDAKVQAAIEQARAAQRPVMPAAPMSPDLAQVLLDVAAPKRTNNESAEEWRRSEAQKRVVAMTGTDAGSVLGEVFNLRKIVAIAIQKLGPQGEPLRLAMDRHLSGDYEGAISAVAGMPASNAAPPTESEREQAKRYARMYLDAAGCEQDADEGTIDAMLPLVREAEIDAARAMLTLLGAYTDDSKPLAEVIAWMHGDMAQRLKVATEPHALLTEDEARLWAENVIRDWRINSGVLSDLLLSANRGEIPPDVRAPTAEPEPQATMPREIWFMYKSFTEPKDYPELFHVIRRLCPALSASEADAVAKDVWPVDDLANIAAYYAAVRAVFPDAKIFDSDGNEIQ